jgi:hypothetical protein
LLLLQDFLLGFLLLLEDLGLGFFDLLLGYFKLLGSVALSLLDLLLGVLLCLLDPGS